MARAQEMEGDGFGEPGQFGTICGGSYLLDPMWRMCMGASGPPHIRLRFGLEMKGVNQPGHIGLV